MQDKIRDLNLCNSYLKKAALYPDFDEDVHPSFSPDLIVVLPAYNEADLRPSIESLQSCNRESFRVQIIVVINHAENASKHIRDLHMGNLKMCRFLADELSDHTIRLTPILVELPIKHAGVGLARKIGMDQAVRVFNRKSRPNGVIVNFDADCLAGRNYLQEIYRIFLEDQKLDASSIYFEHDIAEAGENRNAIIHYELHLRYYIQAQLFTGHPYIFHTVGSSMAVRCRSYCSYGGMNKRKAGEDFYFLNKMAKYGRVKNLTTTRNLVSARNSDRVPFGTGRAMIQSQTDQSLFKTYDFETFIILKEFFSQVEMSINADRSLHEFYDALSDSIGTFISKEKWMTKMGEIQSNAKTPVERIRRFYQWFDSFMIMKFCHYHRDQGHPKVDSTEAAFQLWQMAKKETLSLSAGEWLDKYRDWDRGR